MHLAASRLSGVKIYTRKGDDGTWSYRDWTFAIDDGSGEVGATFMPWDLER